MEHFNGILLHKSGLANKQHTNQPPTIIGYIYLLPEGNKIFSKLKKENILERGNVDSLKIILQRCNVYSLKKPCTCNEVMYIRLKSFYLR